MSDIPTLPISSALAEADPRSLSDLLSLDPEGYTRQDRDRVIAVLRENRARLAAAEAAGQGAKSRATKVPVDISAPIPGGASPDEAGF